MDLKHRHGDEWRWDPNRHRVPITYTISVIDPAEVPAAREDAQKVPFGFSVREPGRADGSDKAPGHPRTAEQCGESAEETPDWIDWLDVYG